MDVLEEADVRCGDDTYADYMESAQFPKKIKDVWK